MDLKNDRNIHNLTQQQLSTLLGISRAQLSRYERGVVCPTDPVLQRLHQALEDPLDQPDRELVRSARLQKCFGRPLHRLTRPCHSPAWRYLHRQHPDLLQRLGPPSEPAMAWLRADSALECLAWRQLERAGACLLFDSPLLLNYAGPPLCNDSGLGLGLECLPCLLSPLAEDMVLLTWPQVHIRTVLRTYRVDGLAVLRHARKSRWLVLEIDGAGHRADADAYRTEHLQLPVLRFSTPDVVGLHFVERLREQLRALFRLRPG